MYCCNCGKESADGIAFCLHCGKSPNEVVATNNDTKTTDKDVKKAINWTVNLVRGCFPWVFAIIFWLTVIGGMIGGGTAGKEWDKNQYRYSSSGMVVGALLGLVGGFLIAVSINGVVATLLKIDENLQYLADKEKAKK